MTDESGEDRSPPPGPADGSEPADNDESLRDNTEDADDADADADAVPLPPPRRRRVKALWVLAAGIVLLVVASLLTRVGKGGGSSGSASSPGAVPSPGVNSGASTPSTPSAAADAGIVSCSASGLGYATARVVVTNHGTSVSSYLVTVDFHSPDGRQEISTATTAVERVGPGRRSPPQVANSIEMVHRRYVCSVADVSPYAP